MSQADAFHQFSGISVESAVGVEQSSELKVDFHHHASLTTSFLNLFIFFAIKNNKLDEPLHTFHFRQWWGVEKVLTRARIEGITMEIVQFLIRSEPNNPGLSRPLQLF